MKNKLNSQSGFFNLRALIGFLLCFIGVFLALLAGGALPIRFGETDIGSQDQTGSVALARASVAQSGAAKRMTKGYRRGGASKNTVNSPSSTTNSRSGGASTSSNATAPTQPTNTIKEHRNALGQVVYSISPSGFDISPPLTKLAKISLPEVVEEQHPGT